jgi:hypothetical protein
MTQNSQFVLYLFPLLAPVHGANVTNQSTTAPLRRNGGAGQTKTGDSQSISSVEFVALYS